MILAWIVRHIAGILNSPNEDDRIIIEEALGIVTIATILSQNGFDNAG
jgi:hypothetical protein